MHNASLTGLEKIHDVEKSMAMKDCWDRPTVHKPAARCLQSMGLQLIERPVIDELPQPAFFVAIVAKLLLCGDISPWSKRFEMEQLLEVDQLIQTKQLLEMKYPLAPMQPLLIVWLQLGVSLKSFLQFVNLPSTGTLLFDGIHSLRCGEQPPTWTWIV
jgi:hypothetical protein